MEIIMNRDSDLDDVGILKKLAHLGEHPYHIEAEQVARGMCGQLKERHIVGMSPSKTGFGLRVKSDYCFGTQCADGFRYLFGTIHHNNIAGECRYRQGCKLLLGDAYNTLHIAPGGIYFCVYGFRILYI